MLNATETKGIKTQDHLMIIDLLPIKCRIPKDPWKVKDIHENTTEYHQSKIYPIKNHIVILADTPVFRTVTDKYPMICLSGSFYFYDDTITKGRAKITKYKDLTKRDPKFILGYIDIKE